jgi:hypothetical protein
MSVYVGIDVHRQEDRHHGGRLQAPDPRLPPAHRRRQRRCAQQPGGRQAPGKLAFSHEPASPRSMT